jgi:hypothetical protein
VTEPDVHLFELVPKPLPCGHVHKHASALMRCLLQFGVPGFELREVRR